MLKENKCLLCKHYVFNNKNPFAHECKAYPNGIPKEIFNDNRNNKKCKNEKYSFIYSEK